MKILSPGQLRNADKHTSSIQVISSLELMERASAACFEWIKKRFAKDVGFVVFAGPGNNGGDGLAIGRMLIMDGYNVDTVIVNDQQKISDDNLQNRNRYPSGNPLYTINNIGELKSGLSNRVVIDSLFGTGLDRPLKGVYSDVADMINKSGNMVISIDMPSGLRDDISRSDMIINADHTLTFNSPKIQFMFEENYSFCGEFTVLDIGLDKGFIQGLESREIYIGPEEIKERLLPVRDKFSHKGTYGHGLFIGTSKGMCGAGFMASKAALRSGAGLITACVPSACNDAFQALIPEAITISSGEDHVDSIPSMEKYSAIAAGPGLGKSEAAQKVIKMLIQNGPAKLVLDADALNILSENKTWQSFIPFNTLLTPHPGEFERLADARFTSGRDRFQKQRELSVKLRSIIILKGAHTSITLPDGRSFFNSTGNPAMAKAGSGDVLTGILLGLLCRGYKPEDAAIIGVYIHGLAADIAVKEKHVHEESLIATDIIDHLSPAFHRINNY